MKRKPRRVTQADYLALGRALARDMAEYDRIKPRLERWRAGWRLNN